MHRTIPQLFQQLDTSIRSDQYGSGNPRDNNKNARLWPLESPIQTRKYDARHTTLDTEDRRWSQTEVHPEP